MLIIWSICLTPSNVFIALQSMLVVLHQQSFVGSHILKAEVNKL